MDGLLIDSEPVWNAARSQMAAEHGVSWTRDDHFNVMGVSTVEWIQYMVDRIGLTMPPDQVEETVIGHMVAMYEDGIPFRPHAVEKVQWMASLYPSCIASGSPRQLIDIVAQDRRIAPYLEFTLAADEVGRGKPHPDIYLETARRLGIEPQHCLCIEDSPFGILSGARAGMKVIGIPDPEMPLSAEQSQHAHLILRSLAHLTPEALDIIRSHFD